MHNAYVTSSLYSFRATKASIFNYYSHLLNQRFDFYRKNRTSCCCCDCCALCLSSRLALRPCYLYGIRHLSLLHWVGGSRRFVLSGECGPGCGEVYRCVGERRRRRCRCGVDDEEERESEVCDFSEGFIDVEDVLSLLSEEVGEEGFGRGRNVGLSKRVEEGSRRWNSGGRRNVSLLKRVDLGGGKRNASLSNRVEEESRRSLGGSRRNLGLSKRVEEENRKSFEGGGRNVILSKRVEEEDRSLGGGRRNVSLLSRVEEESRRSLGGRDKGENSRKGREIIESVSKRVQVDLEENDRSKCRSREKRSGGRYSSLESNSKQREEKGMLLGADSHRGRKEGSRSSYYYSLSSSGDFDMEVDIRDNHGLLEEPGSVKYKVLHNDRVRYDGSISEEYKNQRDNTEVGSEITKHRKNVVEGSGMWDCRKKSETKLTDVVIEETHASMKSAEMHSRVMETNENSSGSQKQFDDERRESYWTRGTKEQYSQAGNQVSETESRRTFQEGKEKLDVHKTDAETTSRSRKRQSEQEQNLAVAENLVQETRDEHYNTTRHITQREEINIDIHKQVSEIQVVDAGRTPKWQMQTDTRTNLDENKNTGQISVKRKEEQCLQTGHHVDQNAIQRVQSGKGTNDVAKMPLVLANDTTRNSNTRRTFEKRSSNQESATLLAATSVEETMQRNKRADEKLMKVKSRKATVSTPQEKDTEEPSSFQASTSMVSQARKQRQDVEERKRSPQAPLLPPHPQSIARGPIHVEFLSETVSPEVSGETSESNLAVKYESFGGNNNTETPMEILHLTDLSNPEDVLGSAQRLEESSSQFFGDFFEKISYGVSTSEKETGKRVPGTDLVYSGENYEQKTLTSSCSLTGNDETHEETSYLTNPEDALGSAQSFDMSSSQFVEEFSKIAKLEDSTSEEYDIGSEAKTEDSQLKGNNSRRSSGGSGTKGPAIEMWDVAADTPALKAGEKSEATKASEKSEAATETVTLEATTTRGNVVAKRTGRSIWNLVADVVKLRWNSHSETHPSAVRSGGKNTTESASSEAGFSGRETEESSEKNVERYKGSLHPVKTFSQTEKAFGTLKSNEEERSSEVVTSIKSPVVEEISNVVYTISGSSSEENMHRFGHRNFDEESSNVQRDTELKRRKFQRTNQVMKDRFDEWEEAHTRETELRKADEYFMREALREAKKAADTWEVSVGAVLVQQGKIIARGFNLVEELRDSTAHAEMICIREASNVLRSWRLAECTLYVTLEPCPMCAGAIYQARIDTIVWGAPNKLLGADGSWIRLFPDGGQGSESEQSDKPSAPFHPFHPNITIRRGVLASECAEIMQQFFQLRRRKKEKNQATTPAPSSSAVSHHPQKILTKLHDMFHVVFCL